MNTLQTALAILGGLLVLAATGGGIYAQARAADRDATEKRLRAENQDYTRRLDYVEPRLKTLEEQNELLLQLHNPTVKLDGLSSEHARILDLLKSQGRQIHAIHDAVSGDGR